MHKIVTGRQNRFDQLRQAGGLSGYPSREESAHDFVENSHASTILSYAYGMAIARDAGTDPHRHIVAVIGDGSMTGGMAYEALNNIGHSGQRVIIILNDNGRSYAPTISNLTAGPTPVDRAMADHPSLPARITDRLSHGLTNIRLNPVYVQASTQARAVPARTTVRRSAGREGRRGLQGRRARVPAAARRSSRRSACATSVRSTATTSRNWNTPSTTRSSCRPKGRSWCTWSPRRGVATRRRRTTTRSTCTTRRCSILRSVPHRRFPPGTRRRLPRRIIKEAEADRRVVAITAAMAGPTGLIPFQNRFPDRFFDVGIAEQHAVTGAAGMAMGGLRPVVAIYSTFLNRAWDQVVYDVALHRLPVVFCLDRAGITGDNGASHHGVYDLALLAKVPGMRVLAPSSAQELQVMLHDAIGAGRRGPSCHSLSQRHGAAGRRARGRCRPPRPPSCGTATARCASWRSASW